MSSTTPSTNASRVQAWLNRAMELLWLLAVFLVPLAFFGQDYAKSEAVIAYVEVPKVALLRTIAGLMAVLWLVDWGLYSSLQSGNSISLKNLRSMPAHGLVWLRNGARRRPHRWPMLAVGFFLGTTFLSTALSGSFRVSFWGEVPGQDSYSTYTVVAYVLLFTMIATRLKTRSQVWRLLGAIVCMGVLVSGYAVLQHYGQDPLHLSESTGGWTTSFMGNRIFAAAVIMMTIPVTIVAAVASLFRFPQADDIAKSKASQWVLGLAILGTWVIALSIQILGLIFTFSRGPWVGSVFGLALMVILVAVFVGRMGLNRLALVLGLACVVTVIVFLNPTPVDRSDSSQRTSPIAVALDPTAGDVADRFGSIGGDVLGGFSGGRLTHWKVSWELINDRPWFAFDTLGLRWLRLLVGYGPDLFRYTYLLDSTAEGPDRFLTAPDHAHNYFIHQTVEQGFLGTLSSLGIFVAVFLAGGYQLRRFGSKMDLAHKLVLIALLSVLAGRALEMLVGVARVSDLTVLWGLLGLFAALTMAMRTSEPAPNLMRESPSRTRTGTSRGLWVWKLVVVACLIGAILNLTWMKGVSYPLAAVQAGHALKHYRQGDLPPALDAIDKAIAIAPDVPVYYNWRGSVLSAYRSGLPGPQETSCGSRKEIPYRTCLAELTHQSNLDASVQRPFEFRSRIALARSAFNLGRYDESIRYYQESLDLVPGSWGLRNNIASALIHIGRPGDALGSLQESLAITKGTATSIHALIIRARAYVDLGRYEKAIGDLDRALEISPDSAPAHAGKAVAHAHLGDDVQAREEADKAVELGADRDTMDKAIEQIRQRR